MKNYKVHLFLFTFQELEMLAPIRQAGFVTFTVGNLSLGDIFFP